jgi:hypothetical protein
MIKKITYWMRKLGMLRTGTVVARNSKELNDMIATEGGMIQSQKEIDERYRPSPNKS